MPTSSPWGPIDNRTPYAPGFSAVDTPGHGGLMLTTKFAEAHLTKEALAIGMRWGDYYCYEEDCNFAIVFFELLEEYGDAFFAHVTSDAYSTNEKRREYLMRSISSNHPEFLIAKGLTPTQPEYENYLRWEEDKRRRAEKDPDLIVSAISAPNDLVKVHTADGQQHFVTSASYSNRAGRVNLLSYCEVVPQCLATV